MMRFFQLTGDFFVQGPFFTLEGHGVPLSPADWVGHVFFCCWLFCKNFAPVQLLLLVLAFCWSFLAAFVPFFEAGAFVR